MHGVAGCISSSTRLQQLTPANMQLPCVSWPLMVPTMNDCPGSNQQKQPSHCSAHIWGSPHAVQQTLFKLLRRVSQAGNNSMQTGMAVTLIICYMIVRASMSWLFTAGSRRCLYDASSVGLWYAACPPWFHRPITCRASAGFTAHQQPAEPLTDPVLT